MLCSLQITAASSQSLTQRETVSDGANACLEHLPQAKDGKTFYKNVLYVTHRDDWELYKMLQNAVTPEPGPRIVTMWPRHRLNWLF